MWCSRRPTAAPTRSRSVASPPRSRPPATSTSWPTTTSSARRRPCSPPPSATFPAAPYTDEHTFHEILVLVSHLAAVTTSLEFVTSVLVLPQRQTALGRQADRHHRAAERRPPARRRRRRLEQRRVRRPRYGLRDPHETAGRADRRDEAPVDGSRWSRSMASSTTWRTSASTHGPTRPIPVWMGTNVTDAALRRVVAQADGWMPLIIPGLDPVDVATGVARLRELCDEAGPRPGNARVVARLPRRWAGSESSTVRSLWVAATSVSARHEDRPSIDNSTPSWPPRPRWISSSASSGTR